MITKALLWFARVLVHPNGQAATIVLTLCTYLMPEVTATFILSVLAIVVTEALVTRGEHRDRIAAERDKAMHAKLDTIIAAIPKANNALIHSEPEDNEK